MPSRPKIPLDYSSPAQERQQEDQAETQRRDALDNYNQSTFGERRPFLQGPLFRWFIFVLIATLVICLTPRSVHNFVGVILALAFGVLEYWWTR
jgi:hypothetical protein